MTDQYLTGSPATKKEFNEVIHPFSNFQAGFAMILKLRKIGMPIQYACFDVYPHVSHDRCIMEIDLERRMEAICENLPLFNNRAE